MIQAKCIEKFKDANGTIFGYRLIYSNGQVQDIKANNLKSAIHNGQIHIVNLRLTSDNRIITTNEYQLQDSKLEQTNKESFHAKCIRLGINPNSARQFKFKHPELTDEQIIQYYKDKDITNKDRLNAEQCKQLGIDYNNVRQLRFKHPELTDMQILKYYLQKPTKTFADKCREANINHNTARQYKYRHPELSEEQVIMYLVSKK